MSTPVFDDNLYSDNAQAEADKHLRVAFHMVAVHHKAKSEAEGRPIFVDVPHITIITPGSRDTFVGEATENYQRRFPRQWAAFLSKSSQDVEGTPLTEVTWLTLSQVAEMKASNIFTVEQLANLTDANAQKIMGNFAIRDKAKRWLDASKGESVYTKLEQRISALEGATKEKDEIIQAQKAEIERLKSGSVAGKKA